MIRRLVVISVAGLLAVSTMGAESCGDLGEGDGKKENASKDKSKESTKPEPKPKKEKPKPEKPQPAAQAPSEPQCDPNYEGACLKPNSEDYDCEGGEGDGPDFTGPVTVVGDDHYDLDVDDADPRACEPAA
jgi:hypothetical protein